MAFKMDPMLNHALRGAAALPPAPRREPRALVIGAGGRLGSALLAEALGTGAWSQVAALVEGPIASALRGFEALRAARIDEATGLDTAFIVFERERHTHGRDDAFVRPDPKELLALATRLHRAGVLRLLVVLPHAPSMLPAALRGGFASDDEAAVAALGVPQLVLLRPAQDLLPDTAAGRMQRLVGLWLSQLRWMVPQQEQALRSVRVAALAVQIARLLRDAPAGTRIVPPGLLWQAAQAPSPEEVLRGWLNNGPP